MLNKKFPFFLCLLLTLSCKFQGGQSQNHQYSNELIGESSPYLLQHAHNPVNWHPWGEKALKKAKEENKMLIISVGYSACHWCHVMEHESFEDTTVARIMNEHFISIKVDREERPDIDDIYMTACQIASERGCGWPLNAFALPDGRPVWAGTYFPRKNWIEVLEYFIDLRQKEPEKLEDFATQLTKGVAAMDDLPSPEGEPDFRLEELEKIAQTMVGTIDSVKGGRAGAPKFPMPNNYEFLLSQYSRTSLGKYMGTVLITLYNMGDGGIYDHLGGGFARYSTDADWKVPHFEKMLYDNGQLVSLYAQVLMENGNVLFEEKIKETLGFIKRELTSPEGGFYSSLDADSEGEEGRFYVWTETEIDSLLKDKVTRELFKDYYNVKAKGNWEKKNILYITKDLNEVASDHHLRFEAAWARLSQAKEVLFQARSKRVRPGLDDKILTSWNGLMLKGYIDAYRATGNGEYLDAALKNANFLVNNMMQEDNRLNRNYKNGKSSINAFLDDYATSILAFIALYEVTFDEQWLTKAHSLSQYVLDHFTTPDSILFYYTSDLDPELITRKMKIEDNVIPSANSMMARALFQLGTFLYRPQYIDRAEKMMHTVESAIIQTETPSFYSNWCQLYGELIDPPYEVVIIGNDFEARRKELMSHYLPNAIFMGGKKEGALELLKDKLVPGETMIYVCRNKVCKLPVTDTGKALELID